MRKPVLLMMLGAIVLVIVAILAVGAFPPRPHTQPVTHTLPNDRFAPRP